LQAVLLTVITVDLVKLIIKLKKLFHSLNSNFMVGYLISNFRFDLANLKKQLTVKCITIQMGT